MGAKSYEKHWIFPSRLYFLIFNLYSIIVMLYAIVVPFPKVLDSQENEVKMKKNSSDRDPVQRTQEIPFEPSWGLLVRHGVIIEQNSRSFLIVYDVFESRSQLTLTFAYFSSSQFLLKLKYVKYARSTDIVRTQRMVDVRRIELQHDLSSVGASISLQMR